MTKFYVRLINRQEAEYWIEADDRASAAQIAWDRAHSEDHDDDWVVDEVETIL
jgi:hypothetical protein